MTPWPSHGVAGHRLAAVTCHASQSVAPGLVPALALPLGWGENVLLCWLLGRGSRKPWLCDHEPLSSRPWEAAHSGRKEVAPPWGPAGKKRACPLLRRAPAQSEPAALGSCYLILLSRLPWGTAMSLATLPCVERSLRPQGFKPASWGAVTAWGVVAWDIKKGAVGTHSWAAGATPTGTDHARPCRSSSWAAGAVPYLGKGPSCPSSCRL